VERAESETMAEGEKEWKEYHSARNLSPDEAGEIPDIQI